MTTVNYNEIESAIHQLAQEILEVENKNRMPEREPGWISIAEYAAENHQELDHAEKTLNDLARKGKIEKMIVRGPYNGRLAVFRLLTKP